MASMYGQTVLIHVFCEDISFMYKIIVSLLIPYLFRESYYEFEVTVNVACGGHP